ncbi:MAG: sialate O-acetylesterase [Phycisphaera sp.]|nr:sialate O-acetylesterase [Phycisphaera sp.]
MRIRHTWVGLVAVCVTLTWSAWSGAAGKTCPANGKLKVFVLAGQSNMVGYGTVSGDKPGTMETCVKANPKDYGKLVDKDGKPVVRDDVWVVNLSNKDKEKTGWLTTGFGGNNDGQHIGPEYGFGFAVGDYYEDPVLIIKCAWGGRSLYHNFLPPSAAEYPTPQKDGDMGFHYAEVVRIVKLVTGDLQTYFPDYNGKGYEIVGFGWHQGWNDRINQDAVDAYESNLVHFIKDMRKDLGVADLPFVSANSGMSGWDVPARYKAKVEKHVTAQLAPGDPQKHPEFKGTVAGVETRDFARTKEQSPSSQEFHWNRNWESQYLIGKAMGEAMVGLEEGRASAR